MLILLTGKSGSGKDTIKNELVRSFGVEPLISTTSRAKRNTETEGREYFFVSREEFEEKIKNKKIFEYRKYESDSGLVYYGMEYRNLDPEKNYVKVLDPQGVQNYINTYGRQNCFAVNVHVSDRERYSRALQRAGIEGDPEALNKFQTEWKNRLADDNERFKSENTDNIINFILDNETTDALEATITLEQALTAYEKRMKEFQETAHLHTTMVYPQLFVMESDGDSRFFAYLNEELRGTYLTPRFSHVEMYESLGDIFMSADTHMQNKHLHSPLYDIE